MVIRWQDPNLSAADKQIVRDRISTDYYFDILNVEECDCQNKELELWTLDTLDVNFIGVEGTLALMDQSGEGDVEGDVQFSFMIDTGASFSQGAQNYQQLVSNATGDVVRIAIVDTGIEYDFLSNPVLHNHRDNNCQGQISGWDYTGEDRDPRDAHGHGTVVTHLIMDELNEAGIPFEIIPIRAFDETGKGNYFDILCSMNYIARYPQVKLVNLSFGWTGTPATSIMNDLIDEMSNQVLFITSAGNEGMDTDISDQAHFPSGYPAENLLSVAGYGGTPLIDPNDLIASNVDLHERSNYGLISIDIAAPYDNYTVTLTTSDQSRQYQENPTGTSYASAFATARAASILFSEPNLTPLALKNAVFATGYESPDMVDYFTSGKILTNDVNQPQ